MNAINGMKSEIVAGRTEVASLKAELTAKIEKNEARLATIETNKSGVTTTEFFRWAVHLQQSNPNIKVPEPEVNK